MPHGNLSMHLNDYTVCNFHVRGRDSDYSWLCEIFVNLNKLYLQHFALNTHPLCKNEIYLCSTIDLQYHGEILNFLTLIQCLSQKQGDVHCQILAKCCLHYLCILHLTNQEVIFRKLYCYAIDVTSMYYPK